MTAISRKRLEYACSAFLQQMARAFASAHPDKDSPVRGLTDYSPEQRSILMKSVGAAIKATMSGSDEAFLDWLSRQTSDQ